MAIQDLTIQQIGPWSFILTWGSTLGTPTYYIYKNGVLDLITTEEQIQYDLQDGENIIVDVFDSISDTPGDAFPNFATLQWNPSADGEAKTYQVQQFIDSVWTVVSTLPDTGRPIYRYQTSILTDDVTHQFRIIPVDTNSANQGSVRNITFRMRRYPPAPDANTDDYVYVPVTGNLTVDEAA